MIDGILASWVRIETKDGIQGWCFSGYLDQIKHAVDNSMVSSVSELKLTTAGYLEA
jgi:hypothetical protein